MEYKEISIFVFVEEETYEDDINLVNEWLERNKDKIREYESGGGCGCCVILWELECDESIIHEIPKRMRGELGLTPKQYRKEWEQPKYKSKPEEKG